MSRTHYLLFDFDGVISNTFDIAYAVSTSIDASLTSEDDYRKYFEGNIYDTVKRDKNLPKPAPTADDPYFSQYAPKLYQQTIDPKIKTILQLLAQEYQFAIISSTVTSIIENYLAKQSIDAYFKDILGPEIALHKTERILHAIDRYNTSAKNCLFITDTLGDIREARKADVDSIAVTWGYHYAETLKQGDPVAIVNTPHELEQEIKKYFT